MSAGFQNTGTNDLSMMARDRQSDSGVIELNTREDQSIQMLREEVKCAFRRISRTVGHFRLFMENAENEEEIINRVTNHISGEGFDLQELDLLRSRIGRVLSAMLSDRGRGELPTTKDSAAQE